MKILFENGKSLKCQAPTEQKIFKPLGGSMAPAGWVLAVRLLGNITSEELDEILANQSTGTLSFISDDDETKLFTLKGYKKVSSTLIKHSEDNLETVTEIQITKEEVLKNDVSNESND